MSWLGYALLTALFESGKDVSGKLALARTDALRVNLAWRLLALPVLLPLLAMAGLPPLGPGFWPALLVSGGLNVISGLLYMRALQLGDLSRTVPLVNLSPALLLVTSPLILGEIPSAAGAAGVVLVVAGAMLLHRPGGSRHPLAPLRALASDPGGRLMLLVAVLWSVSANVDKLGLQNSSPLFWATALNAAIAAGLLPLLLRRRRGPGFGAPVPPRGAMVATGLCGGLTLACQMTAIGLTQVPYVIAIKRTSTLLSVAWGRLFFGEREWRQRLPAVALMCAGVALIVLP